ncbi:hypothetical protein Tco_1246706 [Tanacetum coccineum]
MVENASRATTKEVPSAGHATSSPTEGEKNTNPATTDAEPNLHDELVDLLGIDVVTQYYNKKLLYDKYHDKMLKRRKGSKITNCDVLTQKGPISLQVHREDGTIEVISNVKKVYKAGKRLLYVKRNKAVSLGKGASKVGIEVQQLSLKDCTCFDGETVSLKRLLLRTFPMTCTLCLEVSPPVTFSLLSDFEGVTDWYQEPSIMVAPLSPNHVFDFLMDEPHDFDDSDLEFEDEPEEEPEAENEEEFEEDPEEEEEELEWEDDIPPIDAPHIELSPTSPPPLSGSTFEVVDGTHWVPPSGTHWVTPSGSTFEVGGWYRIFTKRRKTKPNRTKPSTELERARKTKAKGAKGLKTVLKRTFPDRLDNVNLYDISGPSFAPLLSPHLLTRGVKRLRDDTEILFSGVRCLELGTSFDQVSSPAIIPSISNLQFPMSFFIPKMRFFDSQNELLNSSNKLHGTNDKPLCDLVGQSYTKEGGEKRNLRIVVNSDNDNSSSDDDSSLVRDYRLCRSSPLDVEDRQLRGVDILREKLLNVNLLIAKIEALKVIIPLHFRSCDQVYSKFPNLYLEESKHL